MRKVTMCLAVFAALLFLQANSTWALSLGSLGDLAGKAASTAKDKPSTSDSKPDDKLTINLPPWTGPKKRLGVMDVDVKVATTTAIQPTTTGGVVSTTTVSIPPPSDFGSGLTEMLTTALFDSKRFILLERKALTDIQTEQSLGASGAVSADSAAGVGKLLGAQALIRGAVTEFTYNQSNTGGSISALKGVGLGASKAEAAVVLDIRIYDSTTGIILDSIKAEGRAKSSSTSIDINRPDFQMSGSGFSQTPLGRATRQAIERAVVGICNRMDKIPWEGRVAEIDADGSGAVLGLYLNAGSDTGIKVGDELEILTAGRAIIDPETKTVLGRTKDTRIGRCKVETVSKSISIATITEGSGAKIGDIIRFPGTGLKAYSPGQAAAPGAATDGNAAATAATTPTATATATDTASAPASNAAQPTTDGNAAPPSSVANTPPATNP